MSPPKAPLLLAGLSFLLLFQHVPAQAGIGVPESPLVVPQPLVWLEASTIEFRGRTVDLDAGTLVATDGQTYFYATTDAGVADPLAAQACIENHPPGEMRSPALIDTRGCGWVLHPNVGCSAVMDACWAAAGITPPSVPLSPDGAAAHSVPNAFLGVKKVQPSNWVSYGIQGSIRSDNNVDTYPHATQCYHRWPGQWWMSKPPGTGPLLPFIQTGASTCPSHPTNKYSKFCEYRDTYGLWHGVVSQIDLTKDGQWHDYRFTSYNGGKDYRCYWNFGQVFQWTIDGYANAWGPRLEATLEANAEPNLVGSGVANAWPMSPAVRAADGAGTFRVPPSMDYFYEPLNTCTVWGWGVDVPSTNTVKPGTGMPCRTGTAW